jgi:2-polyprenyl-6-methoxyphenol hydroxylase-like FAD-dependent oxidoreductase
MTLDVLVVGGGPVGLSLACELHRHGVRCRIVDQLPEPQIWSKAAVVTPRTLEVLDDMGVGPPMHAIGRPVYGIALHRDRDCIARLAIDLDGTPFPFVLGISQRDIEIILAQQLAEAGGALERPVTLESFREEGGVVHATLLHPGGRREQVVTRWLCGCDGAKSTVRGGLGLPFEGSTFEQNLIQADIRIEFPIPADAHEAMIFLSSHGVLACFPLFAEGRYRAIAPAMPDPDAEATLSVFESVARERAPEGTRFHDPAWVAKFRFHGRVVPRYRVGRVFLAGDAAHIHSPVGGQGMNMGIQDAYNLAWKLALVVRGAGRESLLDSYDPERRPVAAATVGVTDRMTKTMMRAMALRSRVAEALRNQAIAFVVGSGLIGERVFRRVGQLAVEYGASPIVGEHHVSVWRSEIGPGRGSEQPKIGDWMGFRGAVAAGARVPDLDLYDGSTLFELLRGTSHVLLLFDGAAATQAGYDNLSEIASRVSARWGEQVRVHVVVPRAEVPAELVWRGPVLLDADAALHRHFGCSSEGLFLVRPDGYVGFRSQPADAQKILGYLETVFTD